MRRRIALASWATLALLAACHPGPEVLRVVDGIEVPGRFVSPEAYTAYLEGVLAESSGDPKAARAAYERATAYDPEAAEAWARLGAVLCVRDRRSADLALELARALGPHLEEPWSATAECELARGNARRAIGFAEKAARLAPDDAEASLLVVDSLERAGQSERAIRWLRALVLREPSAAREWDRARMESGGGASRILGTLRRALAAESAPAVVASALDRAIREGDRAAARDAALAVRLSTADLAMRAIELGRVDLAMDIAARTVAAEPDNSDARVAALAAADLTGDAERLATWAAPLSPEASRPGPLAARLMADLLDRRVGARAARAWEAAQSGDPGGTAKGSE